MKRNSAKSKLREKGFLLGPFVEVGSPEIVEILGYTMGPVAIHRRDLVLVNGD